ncbi:MAG: hypothetical protein ACI841_004519 [Planctomycetota bacterium]|jgi:hypothetical protein
MALRDDGENGSPEFEVAGVQALQLSVLHISFDEHSQLAICTVQGDYEWGLAVGTPYAELEPGICGIFCSRTLPELPLGMIEECDVRLSDQLDVDRVHLEFESGRELIMIAGESYENAEGQLYFGRFDESVLVFQSVADSEAVLWK